MIASVIISANPVTLREQYAQTFDRNDLIECEFEHRDVGGDWTAKIEFHENLITTEFADDFLNSGLGRQVEIYNEFGIREWIGYINTVVWAAGSVEIRSTFEDWANQIWTRYDAGAGVTRGGTYSDSDSQSAYGIKNRILVAGEAPAATANALSQKELAWLAWPRPYVSDISPQRQKRGHQLVLQCRGYWHSLGWRIHNQTALTGNVNASIVVNDVVSTVGEFIRTSAIDTNTIQVERVYDSDRFAIDVLSSLVNVGGASNEKWVGGVTNERDFYYRAAKSVTAEVDYFMDLYDPKGIIYNRAGRAHGLHEIRPDAWLRVEGVQLPRAGAYPNHIEDPSVTYIVGTIYRMSADALTIKADRNQFADALLKRLVR